MRLVLKTSSYAALHLLVATGVAYALTGNWAVALGIGLIEPLVQTFVFAGHDWLWERNTPNKPLEIRLAREQLRHFLRQKPQFLVSG